MSAPERIVEMPGAGLQIGGLAEMAKNLPTDDWYELVVYFRRTPRGAEVRMRHEIKKVEVEEQEVDGERS